MRSFVRICVLLCGEKIGQKFCEEKWQIWGIPVILLAKLIVQSSCPSQQLCCKPSTMCLATEKANEWDEKGTHCARYVLSSSIPATEIIFKILVRIVFQVTQGLIQTLCATKNRFIIFPWRHNISSLDCVWHMCRNFMFCPFWLKDKTLFYVICIILW